MLCQRPEFSQNPAATHWVGPKNSQESCPMNPLSVCVWSSSVRLLFWKSQLVVPAEELHWLTRLAPLISGHVCDQQASKAVERSARLLEQSEAGGDVS